MLQRPLLPPITAILRLRLVFLIRFIVTGHIKLLINERANFTYGSDFVRKLLGIISLSNQVVIEYILNSDS